MPRHPERTVNVNVADRAAEGEEFIFEQEVENIPDTPEKVAGLLRRALAEVRHAKGEELSDDARFVKALEETLTEFYEARHGNLPPERRPSLEYLISVLEGSMTELLLPPDQVRELMEAVLERFGVPERSDLTVMDEEGPVKNQPGRIGAHQRLLEGLADSWKTLLVASLEEHYSTHFPERVRGEVEDIASAESHKLQEALIKRLVDHVADAEPYRFRRFVKALSMQLQGVSYPEHPTPKDKVITDAELRNLSAYIASRLPEGKAVSADQMYELVRQASPNKGAAPLAREMLTLIVEGFANDLRAVYDVSDPVDLYVESGAKPIFGRIMAAWELFSEPQKMRYLELVKANFVLVEPKGDTGAGKRKGQSVTIREELRDVISSLTKALASGKGKAVERDAKLLAKLIEHRSEEICDYRSKPEEEVATEEAKEQETLSPKELLAGVCERLSEPRAYMPYVLRILMRPDMLGGRKRILEALLKTTGLSTKKSALISRLQTLSGTDVDDTRAQAAQTVMDSEGESENKTGWELLLRAGNKLHAFREEMEKLRRETR